MLYQEKVPYDQSLITYLFPVYDWRSSLTVHEKNLLLMIHVRHKTGLYCRFLRQFRDLANCCSSGVKRAIPQVKKKVDRVGRGGGWVRSISKWGYFWCTKNSPHSLKKANLVYCGLYANTLTKWEACQCHLAGIFVNLEF